MIIQPVSNKTAKIKSANCVRARRGLNNL